MAAETVNRPFSSGSFISPHTALAALGGIPGDSHSQSTKVGSSSSSNQSRTLHEIAPPTPLPDDQDGEGDEDEQPPLIVRAQFDYRATDASALSFRRGDLIEVFTMLESGWWDGMVGGERGWFPSNYVGEVGDDELEDLLAQDEEELTDEPQGGSGNLGEVMKKSGGSGEEIEKEGRGDGQRHQSQRASGGRGIEIGPGGEIMGMDDEILAMEHGLNENWNHWGGVGSGSRGLEDLARGMMNDEPRRDSSALGSTVSIGRRDDGFGNVEDEAREMEEEIARRRRQVTDNMGDFGVPIGRRVREETERTLRPLQKGDEGNFGTLKKPERESSLLEPQDYWVPSMTSDNRIYYHNTQTGEDSWELPIGTPGLEEDDYYGRSEEDFFNTFPSVGPSSSAYAHADRIDNDSGFRVPLKSKGDLPFPWIARMSDDGREYYYVNQTTGETRRDPPSSGITEATDRMKRISVGSGSTGYGGKAVRLSVELQKKAVEEWERQTRDAVINLMKAADKATMGHLVNAVNDALREILEAAVAGSAATEEIMRTDSGDDQISPALATALLREESATQLLASAHISTLAALRDLLSAFGYVGPLDQGAEGMPLRPTWAGDGHLIGNIGLLAASVHAATTSRRLTSNGISVWQEVVQAASKVKDLVGALPTSILAGQSTPGGIGAVEGKALLAWLGLTVNSGDLLNGKWGFGISDQQLRSLDTGTLQDVQNIKGQLEGGLRGIDEKTVLDVVRLANRFLEAVSRVDIAFSIDIEGTPTAATSGKDDLKHYDELVDQARRALHQLDMGCSGVMDALGQLYVSLPGGEIQSSCESLSMAVMSTFRAFSSLQIISQEQMAAVEQGAIVGKIGYRSPKYQSRKRTVSRPHSVLSSSSRNSVSRRSFRDVFRRRARGLEEEFLDHDDYDEELQRDRDEERDRPGAMISASGSQSSLAQMGSGKETGAGVMKKGTISAASSSTSLAYQQTESDSSSMKGSNRSSFMKAVPFLRGRSGSGDADEARNRNKAASKKLAKLLGEESLATVPINPRPPPPPTQTPWYLGVDYGPGEVIFDDKGSVKAGTLKAAIDIITSHLSNESVFLNTFLLTYRSFATGDQVVDLLLERYHIAPPDGLTPEELKEWQTKKQTPTRLRVANTFKSWLDHHMEADETQLLDRIEEFAKVTLVADGALLPSKALLQGVQRRRQADTTGPRGRIPWSTPAPAPLLPRSLPGKSLKLLDINPMELARQLTIMESNQFQKIRPIECLNKAWQREDGAKIASNLRFVILTANRMAGWVASEILSQKDVKQRAAVMKHFVVTAINLRDLNNFSSMAGVVAGLNSAPITRLKRTKEMLSTKTQGQQQDLDRTLDSAKNFANYKELLKNINPPCVPFFGFYLSALTFIEDGNKDFVQAATPAPSISQSSKGGSMTPSTTTSPGMPVSASSSSLSTAVNGGPTVPAPQRPASEPTGTNSAQVFSSSTTLQQPLINFFKRTLTAEILRDIKQYQIQPYNLQIYPPVYKFITSGLEAVEKMGDPYELSLKLEPREREDERITRMLHDSRRLRQLPDSGVHMMIFAAL